MNLPAIETVFIDDYEINLDSASSLGKQPILIRSKPNSKESTKYKNHLTYYCICNCTGKTWRHHYHFCKGDL